MGERRGGGNTPFSSFFFNAKKFILGIKIDTAP